MPDRRARSSDRATDADAPLYRSLGFAPVDGFMALRPTSPGRTG
ncbi:hypothetical protein [Kitasatospora sp. NPDC094016]